MKYRGAIGESDWVFGKGRQNYLTENDAIMRNVESRLKTFYTECFFDPSVGVPWFNLLEQRDLAPLFVALRSQILACYGVTAIRDLQAVLGTDRALRLTYWVDTIYTINVSGGVAL